MKLTPSQLPPFRKLYGSLAPADVKSDDPLRPILRTVVNTQNFDALFLNLVDNDIRQPGKDQFASPGDPAGAARGEESC
jgi:hypothetical protein